MVERLSLMKQHYGEKNTGIRRIFLALRYSLMGLVVTYRHEAAFRQELWLTAFLSPVAFWVGDSILESMILIGSLVLVLIVELINSALESIVDRIGLDHNELAGRAKDQGSAAVFLSLLLALVIWLVIAFT